MQRKYLLGVLALVGVLSISTFALAKSRSGGVKAVPKSSGLSIIPESMARLATAKTKKVPKSTATKPKTVKSKAKPKTATTKKQSRAKKALTTKKSSAKSSTAKTKKASKSGTSKKAIPKKAASKPKTPKKTTKKIVMPDAVSPSSTQYTVPLGDGSVLKVDSAQSVQTSSGAATSDQPEAAVDQPIICAPQS